MNIYYEDQLYQFTFTCDRCKKVFKGASTVKPKTDSINDLFLCFNCGHTARLIDQLDFEI